MKAIIYESNAGHSQRYAEALAKALSLPCYSVKQAKKELAKDDSAVFVGWVMANEVQGFKKARKLWDIKALAAVGMFPKSDMLVNILKEENKPDCPLFYLRGGLDHSKLDFAEKRVIKSIRERAVKRGINDTELIMLLTTGGDFYDEDNLAELIAYCMM